MNGLRIVFLDVDGVLNCLATFREKRPGGVALDVNKVALVGALCRRTGAKVVISSSWRHGRGSMGRLREWLHERGLPRHYVIGRTPNRAGLVGKVWRAPCRGDEIAAWCEAHPVDAFVILDDDADMGALSAHLVRTTFDTGLTPEHCERAAKMLTP